MNINEILTQAKINGVDGVQTAIDDLGKIVSAHKTAVNTAIDAYYASMAKSEDVIKQRLGALEAQQRRIDSDIAATGSALAQAAVSADNTQLERIQTRLSDLEAQKGALAIQIERLNVSQFPRDTKLFQDAVTCRGKQLSALKEVEEALLEIGRNIRTQIHSLESALTRMGNCSTRDTLMRRFDDMRDDYYRKETIMARLAKREKEDAQKAKYAAAAERNAAMFAEIERRKQENKPVLPEFQTIQSDGYTVRSRLNHETGKYEEISRCKML